MSRIDEERYGEPLPRDLAYRIEQFLYQEARCLASRRHREWLTFLADDLSYKIPIRFTATGSLQDQESDELWRVENELSKPHETHFMDEGKLELTARIAKTGYLKAWAFSPPPRTRMHISNVEASSTDYDDEYCVLSNFLIFYSRHDHEQQVYSGMREDRIRPGGQRGFEIASRVVTPDWNVFQGAALNFFI